MFKTATSFVTAFALLVGSTSPCLARGGGGFHGGGGFGGGGFHGGFGGGGFGGAGFRGPGGGQFHGGGEFSPGAFGDGGFRGFDGNRGFDGPRNYGPGLENFGSLHGGNSDRGNISGNHSFRRPVNMPTDFGFGHAGARNYLARGNMTHAWSNNVMRDRGNTVRNNFWNHNYFNHNWWNDHPGAWFAAGWGLGTAWAWTTWPALGAWYGWGDAAPVYYDYGTNVYYDGDEVYYGDQPYASASDYYDQAASIANDAGDTNADQGEWTPLGVFGLVQGEQSNATALFQLATDKSGTIAGNFCDMLSGNNLKVQGSVDQKTQRAAWTVGDNKDTVYEAGIVNLTKDEAPVLVHFGKDRTQQWLLVRMKQPEQAQQQPAPQQQ